MVEVLWAVLGGVCAVTGLTYALWGWWNRNSEWVSRQSVARLVLCGVVTALWAWPVTLLSYPFGLWKWRWNGRAAAPGASHWVVLVHGVYHNRSAWLIFARWLRRAGYRNVGTWSYWSWGPDFWALSRELAADLRRLHRESGQGVVCIGHSMGGLLLRAALCELACTEQDTEVVKGVITLGAPHQGSRLAGLGWGRLARSLAFRGPLINALEDKEQQCPPRLRRVAAVVSPADNMVLPYKGLLPAAGWKVHQAPPVSHIAMLYSPGVFRQVHGVLVRWQIKG